MTHGAPRSPTCGGGEVGFPTPTRSQTGIHNDKDNETLRTVAPTCQTEGQPSIKRMTEETPRRSSRDLHPWRVMFGSLMFDPPSLAHFFPGTSLSVSFRHRAVIGASIALALSGAVWCLGSDTDNGQTAAANGHVKTRFGSDISKLVVSGQDGGQRQRRVPGAGWSCAAATCLTALQWCSCSPKRSHKICPLFALLGRPISSPFSRTLNLLTNSGASDDIDMDKPAAYAATVLAVIRLLGNVSASRLDAAYGRLIQDNGECTEHAKRGHLSSDGQYYNPIRGGPCAGGHGTVWEPPSHHQLPYLLSSWRSCGDTRSEIDVWHQTAPSEWIPLIAVDQGFANATRVVGLMERTSQDPRGPKSTPAMTRAKTMILSPWTLPTSTYKRHRCPPLKMVLFRHHQQSNPLVFFYSRNVDRFHPCVSSSIQHIEQSCIFF